MGYSTETASFLAAVKWSSDVTNYCIGPPVLISIAIYVLNFRPRSCCMHLAWSGLLCVLVHNNKGILKLLVNWRIVVYTLPSEVRNTFVAGAVANLFVFQIEYIWVN